MAKIFTSIYLRLYQNCGLFKLAYLMQQVGSVMRIDHKRKGNREFNDLIRNRQNTPLKDLMKLLDKSLMRSKKGK